MAVVPKVPKVPKTIGGYADHLFELREARREFEKKIKTLMEEYTQYEKKLLDLMEKQETDKGAGALASVSISEPIVAQVEDWDAFYKYLSRTKYFHLLQRRVSDPACRELFEKKGKIPGVTPVKLRKLNLRGI